MQAYLEQNALMFPPMGSQADRVRELLIARGVPDRRMKTMLADTCGIAYQSVKGWFDGSTKTITAENLGKIARRWDANLDWLVSGIGSMDAKIQTDLTRPERITRAIAQSGRSKSEIAELCGVSKETVSKWITGEAKEISLESLSALSKVTSRPFQWLSTGEWPADETHGNVADDGAPPYRATERIAPVISWVQAGEWSDANDPFPAGYADEWERVPEQAGKHAFWLRVVGDSMTASSGLSIPEGMLILVDPDYPAVSGRLVVAKLTDSQQVTFKKYIEDAGLRYLKPLNPDYPMIEINGNCRIIGAVREAKVKL